MVVGRSSFPWACRFVAAHGEIYTFHNLHQLGVVGDDVVGDVAVVLLVEGGEELAGTLDLCVLDALQLEGRE